VDGGGGEGGGGEGGGEGEGEGGKIAGWGVDEDFCILTRLSDGLEAGTVNHARYLALVLLEDLLERRPVPDVDVVPE